MNAIAQPASQDAAPVVAVRSVAPASNDAPDAITAAVALKEIGRGKDGARGLPRAAMRAVFARLLDGSLGEMETGAVLIALRMKGETVEEIEGALDALHDTVHPVPVDPSRPVVAIPSYNGARLLPNLTPLLAGLLADAGVQVVVHGVRHDPARTTTIEVLHALGQPPCASPAIARGVIARGDPAFVPVDVVAPRLAVLLALRTRLGVRNVGHTLAKLMNPTDSPRCLRIAPFTHPEFDRLQHDYFTRAGAPALVLRGTEGEAVASLKRAARIDWLHGGACTTLEPAQTTPMRETAGLPAARDATATALWIQSVLAGERPVPDPIARQVDAVLRALQSQPGG